MAALEDTDGRSYEIDQKDIEQGRKLLAAHASTAWQIGRLTLKVVPDYEPGKHDDGRLEYFAHEIGWVDSGKTVTTLAEYRSAAAHWPADEVKRWPGLSVNSARRLNRFPQETRERILTECIEQHPQGKVTVAAVKEALSENLGPLSSGSAQRKKPKTILVTADIISVCWSRSRT